MLGEDPDDHTGRPVGTSGLLKINNFRAASGVVIFDRSTWGKGLASACHRARCLYAHQVLGLNAIDSSVIFGNDGSLRALRNVGYEVIGVYFSGHMVNGVMRHNHDLVWVNPNDHNWNFFWADNPIPKRLHKARERALVALERARTEVTFL